MFRVVTRNDIDVNWRNDYILNERILTHERPSAEWKPDEHCDRLKTPRSCICTNKQPRQIESSVRLVLNRLADRSSLDSFFKLSHPKGETSGSLSLGKMHGETRERI